ncbi:MAG: hypothetical protein HUJ61_02170 [Bacilli bacterium]|nr:hypothetical protein [Bacilli bacterium]
MFGLTTGMSLVFAILYTVEYILNKKKYIIDEAKYEEICKAIDEKIP